MRKFRTEIQVRGYELDSNGHVNHAVYLNYAEHARWRMMEEAGGSADYFKSHGLAPVVVRVECDYRAACFLAEWLVVETELVEFRKRTAKFLHRILKRDTGALAAEVVIVAVGVDSSGKAVSLPSDFEERFG